MNRTLMLLSAALGVAGMLFSDPIASAQPPAPGGAPPAPAAPTTRPTIAVFNMAAVMRDFNQAKYQVHLLNKKKNDLSKDLVAYRAEYLRLQNELKANKDHPKKEEYLAAMREYAHRIDVEDSKISKVLNDDASKVISDLYDRMKAVVDKTAELNGYHIVFAYPDAVTTEEINSAYIKELKLKPPAAQPFYVAPHADITAVVVKTLNSWYPPVDAAGKPVDVTKLEATPGVPATNPPQPPMGGGPVPPK